MQLSFVWELLGMTGAVLAEILAEMIESVTVGFAVESLRNCHSGQNGKYGHLWILGQNFVGPHF